MYQHFLNLPYEEWSIFFNIGYSSLNRYIYLNLNPQSSVYKHKENQKEKCFIILYLYNNIV